MKKHLIYALPLVLPMTFLFTAPSQAAAVSPSCKINSQMPDEIVPSDQVSGDYWTNMMGPDIVLFTDTGGVSGRFQGYDLKHKLPIRLTTDIDPFPAPDGRHMYIHPSPIQFFNFDETRKRVEVNGENPDTLFAGGNETHHAGFVKNTDPKIAAKYIDYDPKVQGYYESLAPLKTSRAAGANYSTYRVLTGEDEGSIKDYKVTFGTGDKILKVEPVSHAVTLCPEMRGGDNVDLEFDTPIISPKGNEFAVKDRKTDTTVVISFNPVTGKCKKVLDLGFATGKVHFSPDGNQIAFSSAALDNSTVEKPFLYDRRTKSLTSLSVGDPTQEAQGTFPTFRGDGRIVYQRVVTDEHGNSSKDWVTVDPRKFNAAIMKNVAENCANCSQKMESDPGIEKLKKLWELACADAQNKSGSLQWALTVTPETCKAFVQSAAADQSAADRAILTAACPKHVTSQVGAHFTNHSMAQSFPRLLQSKCVICHVPGSPHGYIPFDDPEKMRDMRALGHSAQAGESFLHQVERILTANLDRTHMPHGTPTVPADGDPLDQDQITEVLTWMKDGKKGHYQAPSTANTSPAQIGN